MNSQTIMTGLFGFPVGHSMSPDMHNAAFQHLGLNYAYAAFGVSPERLEQAVAGIRALKFRGVNVTIPHKVDIMPYLDEIDELAADIGAVNTIVNEDGRLIGYNTDGQGYLRSLIEECGFEPQGKHAVIIGAGGAARAVAMTLAHSGVDRIAIANRTQGRAEELAADVSRYADAVGISLESLQGSGLEEADLLINTTSAGMHPSVEELPIPETLLHSRLLVSDLIYNPLQTKLLRIAGEKGAATHNGVGMFIYQGALAFEKWTGRPAPVELMRKAVMERLGNKSS